MTEFAKTKQNRINRLPERGHYDRETIYQILDSARICHVAFVEDMKPFIIPINFARMGDSIVMHGAKASRLLKHIALGNPICVEVTLLDGLVLARSAFHHSVNFHSVVLFGTGRMVEGQQEKLEVFRVITEHLLPGRWEDVRKPTKKELDSTSVVSIRIDEASAKIRSGPPKDDEEDYSLPVWAGILPFYEQIGTPLPDERLGADVPLPIYLKR